jgi:hypothetical protein
MPDIFVSNDNKKGQKKQNTYSLEEDRQVALPGEDVFREIRKERNKKERNRIAAPTIIGSPIGAFSAFKVRPKGVHYHEQDEDEQILLILRKHFVTNITWILLSIIFSFLPLLIYYIYSYTNLLASFAMSPQASIVLVYGYYLTVFYYMFINYITWYYNASLITTKKIVDIHFQDIIYHDVSMTKLTLVEDVNYVQSGFFGSFFGYGNVLVETAGKSLKFDFMSVPNPERVVNLLENLIGGSTIAE